MIILGFPILFYLVGFAAICLANRWWTFIPVSIAIFATEWWFRDVASQGTGLMADTARTMLLLTALGTASGFVARAILLATGWSALRGRGLSVTLAILVAVPMAYGFVEGDVGMSAGR